MKPYIVPIKGDISQLEEVIKNAKGSIARLNDNEVLVKLDYDGNIQKFNQVFDKVMQACPELTVQFQYNINHKLLKEETAKLKQLTDLKLDIEEGNVDKKINGLLADLRQAIDKGLPTSAISDKIKNLFAFEKSAKQLGAKLKTSVGLELSQIFDQKEYQKYKKDFNQLYKNQEKFSLFTVDNDFEKTIAAQQAKIEDLSRYMEQLKSKGASDLGLPSVLEDLQDEVKILKSDISEVKQQMEGLSGEAFQKMQDDVQSLNDSLSETIDKIKEIQGADSGSQAHSSGEENTGNQPVKKESSKQESTQSIKDIISEYKKLYDQTEKLDFSKNAEFARDIQTSNRIAAESTEELISAFKEELDFYNKIKNARKNNKPIETVDSLLGRKGYKDVQISDIEDQRKRIAVFMERMQGEGVDPFQYMSKTQSKDISPTFNKYVLGLKEWTEESHRVEEANKTLEDSMSNLFDKLVEGSNQIQAFNIGSILTDLKLGMKSADTVIEKIEKILNLTERTSGNQSPISLSGNITRSETFFTNTINGYKEYLDVVANSHEVGKFDFFDQLDQDTFNQVLTQVKEINEAFRQGTLDAEKYDEEWAKYYARFLNRDDRFGFGAKYLDKVPEGWKRIENATTAPQGYEWWSNGASRFSNEYQHALVKVAEAHEEAASAAREQQIEEEKLYKYGMRLRGFSLGAQPEGVVKHEEGDDQYHDYLYYNRKLSKEEMDHFSLDAFDDAGNLISSATEKLKEFRTLMVDVKVPKELNEELHNTLDWIKEDDLSTAQEAYDHIIQKIREFNDAQNQVDGTPDSLNNYGTAINEYVSELEQLRTNATETDAALEEALKISSTQDTGSALDLLHQLNQELDNTVPASTAPSSEGVKDESDSFQELEQKAREAAEAKNQFVEENEKLLTAANNSADAVKAEIEALEKLIQQIKNAEEIKKDISNPENPVSQTESNDQNVEDSANQSSEGIDKESESMGQLVQQARDAADAKRQFVESNQAVLSSIVESLKGLNSESEAFQQLNKLIDKLGKNPESDNIKNLIDNLKKIQEILVQDVSDNSLLNSLKDLSNQDLSNLVTALEKIDQIDDVSKINQKIIDNSDSNTFNKIDNDLNNIDEDFEDIVDSSERASESIKKVQKILSTLHNYVEDEEGNLINDSTRSFTEQLVLGRTRRQTRIRTMDAEGNPAVDDDGNPIYHIQMQEQTRYSDVVSQATKAVIDLTKAEHDLSIEMNKTSPSMDKMAAYNQLIEDAERRLDEATNAARLFARENEEFYNDPNYDSKYFMDMFNRDVATDSLKGLSQESIRYLNSVEQAEKRAQTAIDRVQKSLARQETKTENIRWTYDQSVSPGVNRPVTKTEDLQELKDQYDKIQKLISQYRSAPETMTSDAVIQIEKEIAAYDRLAKAKKSSNNVTKKELGGQQLETRVTQELVEYDKLITKSQKYGEETEHITKALMEQRSALEDNKDSASTYYDSIDIRKRNDAEIKGFEDRIKLVEDFEKTLVKAEKEYEKIGNKNPHAEDNFKKLEEEANKLYEIIAQLRNIGILSNENFGEVNSFLTTYYNRLEQINQLKQAKYDPIQESNDVGNFAKELDLLKEIRKLKLDNAKISTTDSQRTLNLERIKVLESEIDSIYLNRGPTLAAEADAARKVAEYRAETKRIIESESKYEAGGWADKQIKNLEALEQSGKYTDEFRERINSTLADLREFLNALNSGANFDSLKNNFNGLRESVEKINIDKTFASYKLAAEKSLANLELRIRQFMKTNSGMGKVFKQQFEEISKGLNGSKSLEEVRKINVEIANLEAEVNKAGQATKSFGDIFQSAFTNKLAQLATTYLSWFSVFNYLKQGIETVRDLDYQLVDLKKTSSMTNSEMKEFYYSSNDVAKQLGVTTSEIIAQSSAWSRLGYSSKEAATEMAKLSSQFAIISPGMSTEQAQEGLVSITKAYGLEVSEIKRTVLDSLNTLGNNFALSNADLVEGMKRSAAALAATGTDFKEALALFTGGKSLYLNVQKCA